MSEPLDARSVLADLHALDALGRARGPATLLAELTGTVDDATREAARAALPPGPDRPEAFAVSVLLALGRPALWLATAWVVERIGALRTAPHPIHERWDALVEAHRDAPEAPWMVAAVLEGLGVDQGALARRVAVGVGRRFGARGRAIAREVAGVHAPLFADP